MFFETITSNRAEWALFRDGIRIRSDPTAALVLSVTWGAGDDRVAVLNVWDSGEAVADSMSRESGRSWRSTASPPTSPSVTASL